MCTPDGDGKQDRRIDEQPLPLETRERNLGSAADADAVCPKSEGFAGVGNATFMPRDPLRPVLGLGRAVSSCCFAAAATSRRSARPPRPARHGCRARDPPASITRSVRIDRSTVRSPALRFLAASCARPGSPLVGRIEAEVASSKIMIKGSSAVRAIPRAASRRQASGRARRPSSRSPGVERQAWMCAARAASPPPGRRSAGDVVFGVVEEHRVLRNVPVASRSLFATARMSWPSIATGRHRRRRSGTSAAPYARPSPRGRPRPPSCRRI
jgi:hypothetical protein